MKRLSFFVYGVLALITVTCVPSGEDVSAKRVRAIVIDAAHGGKDSGAKAAHIINGEQVILKEKEVTLGIAKILKKKLLLSFPDIKIISTREGDYSVPLSDRMERINPEGLDSNEIILYISIHTDWSFDKNAQGYKFLANYGRPEYDESFQLASALGIEFSKAYGKHEIPNRGIINRQFIVQSNRNIQAVMLEMGNINNLDDASLLHAGQGFEKCAAALARGIAAYMDNM